MPKGPQGQKRPADVIGNAIHIARIATGEIRDALGEPTGSPGGVARGKALSQDRRSEIAKLAAQKRWQCERESTMQTAVKETVASGRGAVRMYPNNSLREPVRGFENTVFELVKNTFTK